MLVRTMSSFEDVIPSPAEVDAVLPVVAGRSDHVVAILVTGRGVERTSWSDEVEVSEDDFERLLTEKAPAPDVNDLNGAKFRTLEPASRSATTQRCSECQFRPENNRCLRCGGTGRVTAHGDESAPCSACTNGIAHPCSVCKGTRRSVRVKLLFGEDRLRHFAHIFLPELPFGLREPLTRFFKARSSVPDVLSIDLRDDFAGADAYRGRRSKAEVRGHRADAALGLAKNYVERVKRLPTFVAVEAAAFAWPVVLRGEDESACAAVKDELGVTHRLP